VTGPRQDSSATESQRRRDVEELRAELGDTVEELVHRVDVPERLREKRAETTERVQAQVAHAREVVAAKAPAVQNALRDRPLVVGGALAALLFLLMRGSRRRKQRKEDA
jgi:predicted ATPase with chaperone activity